jgi:hypothetical protein
LKKRALVLSVEIALVVALIVTVIVVGIGAVGGVGTSPNF